MSAPLADIMDCVGRTCLYTENMLKYHLESEVIATAILILAPEATTSDIQLAIDEAMTDWDL